MSKISKLMSMTALSMMGLSSKNDVFSTDILNTPISNNMDESYKRKKCKSCREYGSCKECSYPLNQACSKYTKRK